MDLAEQRLAAPHFVPAPGPDRRARGGLRPRGPCLPRRRPAPARSRPAALSRPATWRAGPISSTCSAGSGAASRRGAADSSSPCMTSPRCASATRLPCRRGRRRSVERAELGPAPPVSAAVGAACAAGWPPGKVRVVGGGTGSTRRGPSRSARASCGLPGRSPPSMLALAAGLATARKNVGLLPRRRASWRPRRPSTSPVRRRSAERPVGALEDRVVLLDYAPAELLERLLRSAAALVSTSLYEGFGHARARGARGGDAGRGDAHALHGGGGGRLGCSSSTPACRRPARSSACWRGAAGRRRTCPGGVLHVRPARRPRSPGPTRPSRPDRRGPRPSGPAARRARRAARAPTLRSGGGGAGARSRAAPRASARARRHGCLACFAQRR